MDEAHQYHVGETVHIGSDGKLGIVEQILMKEEMEIDRNGANHSRDVRYGVRSHYLRIFHYDESDLNSSEKQLHKDAFKVLNGQVILRENKEYVVEDAREVSHSGCGNTWDVWHVKARKLTNGKYNPSGQLIEFDQGDKEPIDIVREMNVETTYK